ncbi:ATP-binding response regulator [Celerinatantimonas yamalensis]|uniref:histidine kinase n=1 Tax=Celerinatantimonas yamalensis TaxID=559956 RepID=A0ABW9G6S9_9GAMM
MPIYYLVAIGFCLPFFFSYMLFMNHWSNVWVLSLMAATFLHILTVYDTKVMLVQAVINFALAYFIADIQLNHPPLSAFHWSYIPIFIFTYSFGSMFYIRNQNSHESKTSLAKSFGASIAHEIRNPLSALQSTVDILKTLLLKRGPSHHPLTALEYQQVEQLLQEANDVIHGGQETIDLLLTSIDQHRISIATFRQHDITTVIHTALRDYSYTNNEERKAVRFTSELHASYFGSDILLKYVLYNLIKNALVYRCHDDFQIDITLKIIDGHPQISIKDNGAGISQEVLPQIFQDFYTKDKASGFGLGLPFCLRVMKSLGGDISCQSQLGQWTEFSLLFPTYTSRSVNQLKLDTLATQAILYIGQSKLFSQKLEQLAHHYQFHVEQRLPQQILAHTNSWRKPDLIFIDSTTLNQHGKPLVHLFDHAVICLVDTDASKPHGPLAITPLLPKINVDQLVENGIEMIEKLLFETIIPNNIQLTTPEKQSRQKSILVVDDNQSVRQLTTLMLQTHGYHVIQANEGQQALQLIAQEPIDLVLMDIEMPVLDGFATTQAIRSSNDSYQQIPIIGHTGDSQIATIQRMLNCGMNDYLVKPSAKENLLNKLTRWI